MIKTGKRLHLYATLFAAMKKGVVGGFLFTVLPLHIMAQKSFELNISVGPTWTTPISYQNCTGRVNPATTISASFLYHPNPAWAFQFSLMSYSPKTYLDAPADGSVAVYTNATIAMRRFLVGINYYFSVKKIRPYIGGLVGFTNATSSQVINASSNTSFSWVFQSGADYYFSDLFGLRLNTALITTVGVSNNSSFFNIDSYGNGFPTYGVGDPSTANMKQWNISLGFIFRFRRHNK